jgi:hypothetical protein
MKLQVVWFKRDLRWEDHAPLAAAVATGQPVVALLLHEPSLWAQPVYSNRHACFEYESAAELFATRPPLGGSYEFDASHLSIKTSDASALEGSALPFFYVAAEATEAFEALEAFAGIPIGAVFSHQEIGIET